VRHTLVPPAPAAIQAATAWRATVRPRRRQAPLRDLAALAICVALLSAFVWTLPTGPEPEPTRITARAVAR
jgi:hypothetical protein